MKKLYLLLVCTIYCLSASAQAKFTEGTSVLKKDNESYSTIPAAIADMNGDFLDDLVFLDRGIELYIGYQRGDGGQLDIEYIGNIGFSAQWTIGVGDFNNDGYPEVYASGINDGLKIYSRSAENPEYTLSTNDFWQFFAQASNSVDINNDGWLDLFICDDDAASKIFMNDQSGNLIYTENVIDFATIPVSDNSGNYGSEWIDIDGDDDLDLYIAKCRGGVDSPTDPRRINALFINNGDGSYTEKAAERNMAMGDQSWTGSFGDIDNDGDMDCYVTNHYSPHMMMENDGQGYFTSIPYLDGDLNSFSFQGILRDFDNDGWMDVLISGERDYLLMNNGDKTFTRHDQPFGIKEVNSYAVGDINDDGFLDVFVSYGVQINNPGNYPDEIWLGENNGNNFLKINLVGEISNRSAIGAKIDIHGEWGSQTRQVKSGESYSIVNSLCQHFGLGKAEKIDSVTITWPSGIKDRYEDLEINKTYIITEAGCVSNMLVITDEPITLCEGENVGLTAPDGYLAYEWSTGEDTQNITVDARGSYFVKLTDENGCIIISRPVVVNVEPQLEWPLINYNQKLTDCGTPDITLTAVEGISYQWSTGDTTKSIRVTENGTYSVAVNTGCSLFDSENIVVDYYNAEAPVTKNDTIKKGEDAALVAIGDHITWYSDAISGDPVGEGDTLKLTAVNEEISYYAENSVQREADKGKVGMENQIGSNQYHNNILVNGLVFRSIESFVLKSVKVITDTPGKRNIEILDGGLDFIYNEIIDIPEGESRLILNAEIPAGGQYYITTNREYNEETLGFNSPRLQRSNLSVQFPYTLDDVVSIESSGSGITNTYYYFFDWEVEYNVLNCKSERVEAKVVIDSISNINEIYTDEFSVSPNPASEMIFIQSEEVMTNLQTEIYDISGKKVASEFLETNSEGIHVANLESGLYLIHIIHNDRKHVAKFLVVR